MKALLVSNGELEDINLLKTISKEVDFILVADGGANHCIMGNIIPDLIIGDLDSIADDVLSIIEANKVPILKYPTKKNATDTEICLDYLIEHNYNEIIMLGSLGSRVDHSIANIFLLEYLLDNKVDGRVLDEKNIIYLVEGSREFKSFKKNISIIPISDDGIEVSLYGLEYPLDHKYIKRGSTLGVSNEFKDSVGKVIVHRGRALVIISED